MLNKAYYLSSLLRRLCFSGFVDPSNDAEYFYLNARISEVTELAVKSQDFCCFAPLVEDILTKGYCITVADLHATDSLMDKLNEMSKQEYQTAVKQFGLLGQSADIQCVEFDAKLAECFDIVLAVAISYGVQLSDHVIRYRSRLSAPIEFSTKFEEWLEFIENNGINETTLPAVRSVLNELKTLCKMVEEDMERGINAPESYLEFFRQYKRSISYCLLSLGSKSVLTKLKNLTQQTAIKRTQTPTPDAKIMASVVESMDTYYFQETR